jgi:hypothetical protein
MQEMPMEEQQELNQSPEEEMGEDETPNVAPEEQEVYDKLAVVCLDMVYGEQYQDALIKALIGGKADLVKTIGMLSANIVQAALSAVGSEIDPEIVLQVAANELVPAIVELAETAKLTNDAEQLTQDALFEGLKIYGERELQEGRVTPEAMAEAKDVMMQGMTPWRPNRKQRREMKRRGIMEQVQA